MAAITKTVTIHFMEVEVAQGSIYEAYLSLEGE